MPRLRRLLVFISLATTVVAGSGEPPPRPAPWPEITPAARPWTRWWWPGSAVDEPGLTRELTSFAAAGLGGVEITPIYGAKGAESRYVDFLSPRYLELLAHVGAEAHRLGLRVDMATGTGWPFGGPQVTPADAELKIAFAADGSLAPIPTAFRVKRAAPGGAGLVVDPYSTSALANYLAPIGSALDSLPPGTLSGQFHDSFEYQADWSAVLPARFLADHGYDLAEHAAALAGHGDPDTTARLKADYRSTLAALHLDYVRAWVDWAHARGQSAREQAHGAPANLLDLYAAADIPETEIFGSLPFPIPGFRRDPAEIGPPGHPPIIHRFASSAAHVAGHPLASAETFTWLREHFHESPSQMKPEADALFLAGINRLVFHGAAYSPADAPWPGWLFYASSQLNPRNPLWSDFAAGPIVYITRCQSLLQAGTPDNDLLVYWPVDDVWHDPAGLARRLTVHASWLETSRTGALMTELTARGYSYDLISAAQLEATRAADHALLTPSGLRYRALLVPRTDHLPVATLRRFLDFAEAGVPVLFVDALPADVPGYGRLAERRAEFQQLLTRVAATPAIRLAPLAELLATAPITRESLVDSGLQFIRRRLPDGHVYFLANLTAHPIDLRPTLARPAAAAALLYPLDGVTTVTLPTVPALHLDPGESIFLRTLDVSVGAAAATPAASIAPPHALSPAGAPLSLAGPWQVTALRSGPARPPAFTASTLTSWTDQPGEWQRFAGTARYETTFTLPADLPAADWCLDLGDVRETARVTINGHDAGLIWALPFRLRLGLFLRPGKNTLVLEVTNLAANRIRDLDRRGVPWKNFHEINFVNIHYRPLDASTWPLQPSGLLGPVTLTPLGADTPTPALKQSKPATG